MSDDDVEVNPLMVAIITLNPTKLKQMTQDDIKKYKNEIGPYGFTPYKQISLTIKWLNKIKNEDSTYNNNLSKAIEIREILNKVPDIDKTTGIDPETGNFEFDKKGGKSRKQKTSKRKRRRTSKKNNKTKR
jgi:hypothetical protein